MTKNKMKIKKGDKVIIVTGKDKGKQGEVLKSIPSQRKLLISGLNTVKKHKKADRESAGAIISKEMPIHISNVALLDPKLSVATKLGFQFMKDGKKVRYAKKSGEMLDSA